MNSPHGESDASAPPKGESAEASSRTGAEIARLRARVTELEEALAALRSDDANGVVAAALGLSEERRRLALDAAELGSWNIDPSTNVLDSDARFRIIFHGSSNPISYEQAFAAIHPDDRQRVRAAVAAATDPDDPAPYAEEYRVVHADGRVVWVSGRGRANFRQEGSQRLLTSFDGTVADITERQEAERALAKGEELYRLAARATNDAIWNWDLLTNEVQWNEAVRTLFGFVDAQVEPTADWWITHIHPDDRERVAADIHRVIEDATLAHWSGEYRFLKADGSAADVFDRGFVIRDAAGRGVRMIGAMQDLTERKRAGKALLESESRLRFLDALGEATRTAADSPEVVAAAARLLGEHLAVSRCAYATVEPDNDTFTIRDDWRATGVSSIAGTSSLSAYGPRSASDMRAGRTLIIRDALTDLDAASRPMFDAIGARAVICCPLVQDGQLRAMMAVQHNLPRDWTVDEVTLVREVAERSWAHIERVRSAAALQTSEERFRQLAETIPQLAWMARADGWIYWYNRRWYEYTGTTPAQMEGWDWQSVHDPAALPEVMKRWQLSIASGEPFDMEFPIRGSDGHFRPFLTLVMPLKDADGKVVQWFGTNTDVTQQHQILEQRGQLLAAERAARSEVERVSRMKDEFVATLSHELRTPLNAILGWAHIIARGHTSPEDLAQGVDTIKRNAQVQVQMIEDLLDVSRITSGKVRLEVQRLGLCEVIDAALDSIRPMADAKEIRVQKLLDRGADQVNGDPSRLQQVVWNLLSNAVKFTPKGGRIQVLLERVNSHVALSVSDSGQGIDPEFIPYVFDRFRQGDQSSTRKFGGLGLGLSIVKQLVELHGGSVRAKSQGVGHGATFVVTLPLSLDRRPTGTPSAARVEPSTDDLGTREDGAPLLAGLTVVYVDDEPDSRELVQRILAEHGARVLTAGSAADGRRLLSEERPDVLVTDIGMPDEDGYDLIRKVRSLPVALGGRIPAAAITALARSEDRRRALLAGFQTHVAKPVEPVELVAVVASLAGRTGR